MDSFTFFILLIILATCWGISFYFHNQESDNPRSLYHNAQSATFIWCLFQPIIANFFIALIDGIVKGITYKE